MRKIQSLIATTSLVAGGLVAATVTTPANSAAPDRFGDPYPGSVNTNCHGKALNKPRAGKPAKVQFRVTTGGDADLRGRVFFTYERKRSGLVVDEFKRRYDGPGFTKYAFDNIPKGRYTVRVFFDSRPTNSVYKNCRTNFSQRVRRAG